MLDAVPKESEARSWIYAAIWTLFIYCTVPFASNIREWVAHTIGTTSFLYLAAAILVIVSIQGFRTLRKRDLPLSSYLVLSSSLMAFLLYAYTLRELPIEVIHLVQYAALSVLVYRALVHRIHDVSIYVVTALVVGSIGLVEEWIQWLVPSRYWDLSDVRINFTAGALAQIMISALRPSLIKGFPTSISMSRLLFVCAFAFLLLGLSFANTPERVDWYASRIPWLSHLPSTQNIMIDYGHRYDDQDIGVFKSRFSPEELDKYTKERGLEVAQVINRYISTDKYKSFLREYSIPRDAYAYEVGIRLSRRNYFFDKASEKEKGKGKNYAVAFRENQILEKYFANVLQNSSHYWSSETRAHVEQSSALPPQYASKANHAVVTFCTEAQALAFFTIVVTACFFLGIYFRYVGSGSTLRL